MSAAGRRWVLAVLAGGLLLRLWNIDYPAWKFSDEQNVIDRALLLGAHGPNPGWFIYPSLFFYVLFPFDAALYVVGRLSGAFASTADFAAFYFAHPLVLHLVGRSVALILGMGCLAVCYRVGRDFWGHGVGLAAAGLLAVSPVYVFAARLAKPDILMALFVLFACWAILRYLDAGRPALLVAAGLAIGLAASAKYPAALAGIFLLVAPWVRQRDRRTVLLVIVAVAAAGVGFLVGTPFAALDWRLFWSDFVRIAGAMERTHYGMELRLGYAYYVLEVLPYAFGWPAAVLALAGWTRWLVWGGARERLLAGFSGALYGWMGYSRIAGDLYILPVYPILALAAADLVRAATAGLRVARPGLSRWVVGALAVVCLLPPLTASVKDTLLLSARETRELAGAWLVGHLPPGTRILSEPYGPLVPVTRGRLDEILAEEERRRPGRGLRTRFERDRARADAGFWYHEMELLSDAIGGQPFLDDYDLDRFLARGFRVVVLSSAVYDRYRHLPQRFPIQNAFFDRVSREGTLIARFDPGSSWCCATTLNARLSEMAVAAWGRPGSTLLVYRVAAR
jgi:hypothetical protein